MTNSKAGLRLCLKEILVLTVVLVSLTACDDCDPPTGPNATNRLGICGVGFSPESEFGFPASMGVTAGFLGDPIPSVTDFEWLGRAVGRLDEGAPAFDDQFYPAEYRKEVGVSFRIDGIEKMLSLTIPDSFQIIKPPYEGIYLPPDEPYEVIWSRSADADIYVLNLTIIPIEYPEVPLELDSSFFSTDTTYVIPAELIMPRRLLWFQLGARIGVLGKPGEAANYSDSDMTCFLSGFYSTAGFEAEISSTASAKQIRDKLRNEQRPFERMRSSPWPPSNGPNHR